MPIVCFVGDLKISARVSDVSLQEGATRRSVMLTPLPTDRMRILDSEHFSRGPKGTVKIISEALYKSRVRTTNCPLRLCLSPEGALHSGLAPSHSHVGRVLGVLEMKRITQLLST